MVNSSRIDPPFSSPAAALGAAVRQGGHVTLPPSRERRVFVLALAGLGTAGAAGLSACAAPGAGGPAVAAAAESAVVFVHGNGDTAALWIPTIWRFESNGWPRARLVALEMPNPLARDEDDKPQPGRSSSAEAMAFLAAEVERVLARTGARRVILVGNSRGGYPIRNYLKNGGGASRVSHVVLGGVPNHGVWATDFRLASEFNGKGPFLTALNAPQGPDGAEVTPGPRWLTLRSDGNDKFAQPTGEWIGQRGVPTNVGTDGPALRGATNLLLGQRDHREVSFHPEAFAATWQFITGAAPARTAIVAETQPMLDGMITGLSAAGPTNQPLPGARLEVYAVSPATGERIGGPVHSRTVGTDGRWGPFAARPDASYEFVVSADGYATLHLYRSPFPRSTDVLHLRAVRMADADRAAGAVVAISRPRGYFDTRRDTMSLDGKPLQGVPPGVAGVSAARVVLADATPRPVVAEFNGERIVTRPWPAKDGHLVVAELTY